MSDKVIFSFRIDSNILNFLREKNINISSLINSLLEKYINEIKEIDDKKEEENLEKNIDEMNKKIISEMQKDINILSITEFLKKYNVLGIKFLIEKYKKNTYFLKSIENEILKYISFDEFNKLLNNDENNNI